MHEEINKKKMCYDESRDKTRNVWFPGRSGETKKGGNQVPYHCLHAEIYMQANLAHLN